MQGEVSSSYDGPKDGSPLIPEWICQWCNRDKSKCIYLASEKDALADVSKHNISEEFEIKDC